MNLTEGMSKKILVGNLTIGKWLRRERDKFCCHLITTVCLHYLSCGSSPLHFSNVMTCGGVRHEGSEEGMIDRLNR